MKEKISNNIQIRINGPHSISNCSKHSLRDRDDRDGDQIDPPEKPAWWILFVSWKEASYG